MTDNTSPEAVGAELTQWFFDDYLPTWVGVGNESLGRGPEFILDYWSTPLMFSAPAGGRWLLNDKAVVGLLSATHDRLREQGYAYTAVPDRAVSVYHPGGGAIEVIWSRCRADDTEIERLAVHFEVTRIDGSWRIISVQRAPTTATSLHSAWNY